MQPGKPVQLVRKVLGETKDPVGIRDPKVLVARKARKGSWAKQGQ